MDTIKEDLKSVDSSLLKLKRIGASSDKDFERWHDSMLDLQKKLTFVDKTLFKR
jgi:hypothetical protein